MVNKIGPQFMRLNTDIKRGSRTKLVKGLIDGGYEEKIIHFIKNFVSFFSMGKGELNQDL